jgi:hypothetical protein
MAEVDLIPASWRAERRIRRHIKGCAIAIAGVVLAILAGRIWLELSLRAEQAAIQQIQGARRDGEREAAHLSDLQGRVAESHRQRNLIVSLRGSGPLAHALLPLDQALDDTIWFDELHYARQAILPQPGTPPPPAEASLSLRGKAPDAAGIGRFADALVARGPCIKPQLVPGAAKHYTRFELVEFSVSCTLKTPAAAESGAKP